MQGGMLFMSMITDTRKTSLSAESVPSISMPSGLDVSSNNLDEEWNKMATSHLEPRIFLAGPQTSQYDNRSVSTRLGFKKANVQKPPIFSRRAISPGMVLDFTVNGPPTLKCQRQEAVKNGVAPEQSRAEQGPMPCANSLKRLFSAWRRGSEVQAREIQPASPAICVDHGICQVLRGRRSSC